ncbi:MAG: diguanylate cyclase domain-containing protein [Planctomycetota bacterium]|jgi:GGDEF domain-containing protein
MSAATFDRIGSQGQGNLTISGGLATFPADASNAKELFEKADQAMLQAKRDGKNRIHLVGQSEQ